jgi:starch synthase (maltosyl-transferring)
LSTGSVCVSKGVSRFSREVAGLNPARLTVIPNGIDPVPFDRATRLPRSAIGVPDDAHLALCVGRIDLQKGLPDLLLAAERVIAHRSDWHLALAGDGPNSGWLIRQINERPPLRDKVHWLGRRDDIPGLLHSADILVHPSLWEGMPNAVLEAMAARRAVVGTAVEGTEDLIVPGRTGWLVPASDVDALSRALIEAADSPECCQRFGEAGRIRVQTHFSVESTVAAYEQLWTTVLGFRPPDAAASPPDR